MPRHASRLVKSSHDNHFDTALLQYAIQVNRDPMAAEMQRLRHQLEVMQAELICARSGGPSLADIQVTWSR